MEKADARPGASLLMVWGQPVRGRGKQADDRLRESIRHLRSVDKHSLQVPGIQP